MKSGYKQTEVGILPEEWGVSPLGSLCDLITKGTTPTSIGRTFTNTGVVFLKAESIGESGRPVSGKVAYIDDCTHRLLRRSQLAVGDLLISIAGVLGRVGFVEECDLPANTNQALALVRLSNPSRLQRNLLFYFLRSPVVEKQIRNINVQAAQANISLKNVRDFVVPIPHRESEQRAIAAALSDVDALLDALDRLIAKKRDLKQAAMQQLLTGQKRLPGFRGEWELKRLDKLGVWKGGMTPSMQNPDYWLNGMVPWISSGDVKSVLLTETGFSVTASAVKQGTTTLLPANSIVVVTRSGILRKCLPVAMNVIPMAINQDIKALIPTEEFCSTYLLHALIGNGDRILARCLKAGTTVESIEFRWLKAFTITLPSRNEQTAIAEVLSDMDAELTALTQRRDKTRALKQGMMQELLTGRTRLV